MRPKTLVLMGVAIACGLAASFMTAQFLKPHTATVLVAVKPIAKGSALTDHETMFKLEEKPAHQVPPGSVTSFEQLKPKVHDHFIRNALNPGDALAIDNIVDRKELGLVNTLKPGLTALSVRATAESSLGGLIEPGNLVKVITLRKAAGMVNRSVILMKNIRVLAVDNSIDKTLDKKIPNIITLEVDDEETKKLRLAQEDGPLTLGLMRGGPEDRKGEDEAPFHDADDVLKHKVKVLVARQPMARNTALKDLPALFTVKEVLKVQLPANHVSSLDELISVGADHVVVKPMRADEPLSLDYVAKHDQPAPVAAPSSLLTIVEPSRQRTYLRQPSGKVVLIDSLETPVEPRTQSAVPPPPPPPAATVPPMPVKE